MPCFKLYELFSECDFLTTFVIFLGNVYLYEYNCPLPVVTDATNRSLTFRLPFFIAVTTVSIDYSISTWLLKSVE